MYSDHDMALLAPLMLDEIDEYGVDDIRMQRLAGRLGLGVGTLYRRYGGRLICLEYTWRYYIRRIDDAAAKVRLSLSPTENGVDWLWASLDAALPQKMNAFLALNSARQRWLRGEDEGDGAHIPGLMQYVDAAQRHGHIRPAAPRMIASMIWWFFIGAASRHLRVNLILADFCRIALKRMILTEQSLKRDPDSSKPDHDGLLRPLTAPRASGSDLGASRDEHESEHDGDEERLLAPRHDDRTIEPS